jgi:hypothetical protein
MTIAREQDAKKSADLLESQLPRAIVDTSFTDGDEDDVVPEGAGDSSSSHLSEKRDEERGPGEPTPA